MIRLERDPTHLDALKRASVYLCEHDLFFQDAHETSVDGWSFTFKSLKKWGQVWELGFGGQSSGVSVVKQRFVEPQERYYTQTNRTPTEDNYLPKILLLTPTWIFFEKLEGLEEEALISKVIEDRSFAQLYSQGVVRLMKDAAESHLGLWDVIFVNGKNCMVNQQTGEIKLVERINIQPSSHHEPNELVAEQLLRELRETGKRLLSHGVDNITVVASELLAQFANIYGGHNLFTRAERITPNNPLYRRILDSQRGPYQEKDITDVEFEAILAAHRAGANQDLQIYYNDTFTRSVDPELISAACEKDLRKFAKLLANGQVEKVIDDPKDPRSKPAVLPDKDFFFAPFYIS